MDNQIDEISLRPNDHIQKLLLSTPAQFVGEFDTPNLLITHAWPPIDTGRPRWFSGRSDSLSRTAIVLAFRTPEPPPPTAGAVVPNYENAGEIVSSALSVLFGKRFDSHGPFEMTGRFGMPELSTFTAPCEPHFKHNNGQPRADRAIPLNFSEVGRIAPLLWDSQEDPRLAAFHAAARFYRRALMAVEGDPESAYLNLITAGEIVSNFHDLRESEILDSEALHVLSRIEKEMPDGVRVTKFLRSRLRGIKRRFVAAISEKIDVSFFDRMEARDQWAALKKEDFKERIGAAYDLRSRFVHSGYPFGSWISFQMNWHEIPLGKPTIPDNEMAAVLTKAPLFSGLERIIRYVILTFAAELGAKVEVEADTSLAIPSE